MGRQTSKRVIVAVCNDLQVGSSTGILDPDSLLSRWDDVNSREVTIGVADHMNPAQRYLFDLYNEKGIKKVVELAGDDDLYVIVNGDYTQGDRFGEFLTFDAQPDQVQIASDLICRWVKECKTLKGIRLTKSTQVHAYKEGVADNAILTNIRERYPKLDIKLVSHGLLNISGTYIDYAHHGPSGGIRNWTKGNILRLTALSLIKDAMQHEEPIPNVILRAHKHEQVEEWIVTRRKNERIKTLAVTVPSLQLMTPHAQKVTQSESIVTNGMLALDINDRGISDVHWLTETRSYRDAETL